MQKEKPRRGLYGMSAPGRGNSSMFPGLEARESMLGGKCQQWLEFKTGDV